MNYTQAPGEKSTVKLTINFTVEEWEKAINSAYLKIRGKYTVPGFRKGKAPKPVMENFYGKGVFYEEAFNFLYSEHYPQIIEKEKENFTAVGEPSLNVESISDDKGVVLTAVVPVKPDVEIESYKGLKIKKYEYNVTDAQVEAEMNKILESSAKNADVTDRPAKSGDTVNIDFSGSIDGVKFPGGAAEGYDLVLGSGSFIPGFEEQVAGMSVGEEKDINVKFPDDYSAEELRGKDAVFAIKLHKITEKQLPELTDEFVKEHAGCGSISEYAQKTHDRLLRAAEQRGRDETENSIVKAICEKAKCEIPDAMIESEIDSMVQEFSYRLMYQGVKLEDYLKYMGQELADFRKQFAAQATERVMGQLVIDKIVRTENIVAADGEVEEKIAQQAKEIEKTAEEYKKDLDARRLEYIKNDIVITKLFDFLKANNTLYTEEEKEEKPAAKKTAKKQ